MASQSGYYTTRINAYRFDTGTDSYLGVAAAKKIPNGPCFEAIEVTDGSSIDTTTYVGTMFWDGYNIINWDESGRELVFKFYAPTPGDLTASLSGLLYDLDVFILDSCSNQSAIAYGNISATASISDPGWYYIVVDGYNGVVGDFTLSVDFTGMPNLTNYTPSGWDYPVVPRDIGGATFTNRQVTDSLPGNQPGATYINWAEINDGSETAGPHTVKIFIDDEYAQPGTYNVSSLSAGSYTGVVNHSGFTVKGGRHTVKCSLDVYNNVSEIAEDDNVWEHQFIWTPLTLSKNTPVSRTRPPDYGPGAYPNSDGFRFSRTPSYAQAIGITPYSSGDDYDLRVYTNYSGSESGFSILAEYSSYGASWTDFVVSTYNVGESIVFPAVTNVSAPYENSFSIESDDSYGHMLTMGSVISETLLSYEILDVFEVYLLQDSTYRFYIENLNPISADVRIFIYPSGPGYYGRSDFLAYSSTEELLFVPTVTGWYPIVIAKSSSNDLPLEVSYDLGVKMLSVGTWIGVVSTDWHTPDNWVMSTIPTSSVDVNIPSWPTNMPIISNNHAYCRNITVENGASLLITNNKNLTVYGDVTNHGTIIGPDPFHSIVFYGDWYDDGSFSPASGSYVYANGSGIQDVFASNPFPNFTIGSSSTVMLTDSTHVTGNFFNHGSIMGASPQTPFVVIGSAYNYSGSTFYADNLTAKISHSLVIKNGATVTMQSNSSYLSVLGTLYNYDVWVNRGFIMEGYGSGSYLEQSSGTITCSGVYFASNSYVNLTGGKLITSLDDINYPGFPNYPNWYDNNITFQPSDDYAVEFVGSADATVTQGVGNYFGKLIVNKVVTTVSSSSGEGMVAKPSNTIPPHRYTGWSPISKLNQPIFKSQEEPTLLSNTIILNSDIVVRMSLEVKDGSVLNLNGNKLEVLGVGLSSDTSLYINGTINLISTSDSLVNSGDSTIAYVGTSGYLGMSNGYIFIADMLVNDGSIEISGGKLETKTYGFQGKFITNSGSQFTMSGGVMRLNRQITANSGSQWNVTGGEVHMYGSDHALIGVYDPSVSFYNLRGGNGVTYTALNFDHVAGHLLIENKVHLLSNTSLNFYGDTLQVGDTLLTEGSFIITGALHPAVLQMGNNSRVMVQSGGSLSLVGNATNRLVVTHLGTGRYYFEVYSGAQLGAKYTTFEYMKAPGIRLRSGSVLLPSAAFENCVFRQGASGGLSRLITFNNSQTLTIENVVFPENTWGSTYNVYKSNDAGNITFLNATGLFAGEDYDYDPNNRIDWTVSFIPGDANGDGTVNDLDLVYLSNYLFHGGSAPSPFYAGDNNHDCDVTKDDLDYLANYLYYGGPLPSPCGTLTGDSGGDKE